MNLIAKTASPGPGVSVPSLGPIKIFRFFENRHLLLIKPPKKKGIIGNNKD